MSYNDLIEMLQQTMKTGAISETSRLGASCFMARRTAGRIVRNAASLGGNTMIVLKHIAEGTGEPFPSDLFTVLDAIEARIGYFEFDPAGKFVERTARVAELIRAAVETPALLNNIVLVWYELPVGDASADGAA